MRDIREIVRDSDTVDLIRHELTTPIATALLYIGIAENYANRMPVDPITPALRIVRAEVQRLKALIENMTELQRSGRPFLRPRFIDVGATVRAAAKRLLTTFAGTESVSISGPTQPLQGWWDPTAVEQIVTNLLSNALKFGQGRTVRLIVREAAAGVSIAVRDQGAGIVSADRLRIFNRYEHAPAAHGGGMGLGLWLVRELVMAHGGRVTVQSRKGRGTTFTVLLREQQPMSLSMSTTGSERNGPMRRLPAQRSPMRTVSTKASPRPTFPAYWQDRLVRSQVKTPSLPRNEIDVAPTSTMRSPSLTAYLKASCPSRIRKSSEESMVRASVPRRPLKISRNFAPPSARGSGP
jgi:anti-sigma regulatory factor (Ser/Thr protein kinase)